MPRRARLVLPNVPMHVVQRGHNGKDCFHTDDDYRVFLYWLRTYAPRYRTDIHAYVLMTNHIHLLICSGDPASPAELMKALAQRYTQYVNWKYDRRGTLWQGRFYSSLVASDDYLLACYRYIELNPVRAGMVEHPGAYQWSSYSANARGVRDEILRPHPSYAALGNEDATRQAAYRKLFNARMQDEQFAQLRRATKGNSACGSPGFLEQVETAVGRRVAPARQGRPRCHD